MSRDITLHLLLSAIGIIVGISAFFVFFIVYGNHDVGFWSILSGALAGVCFHLHWVKALESLDRWHTKTTLGYLNVVGFFSAVAGITAFIWYIFLAFYYKIPLTPISNSKAISAVWAMICSKWGIFLTYYTNKYEQLMPEGSTPMLSEQNA